MSDVLNLEMSENEDVILGKDTITTVFYDNGIFGNDRTIYIAEMIDVPRQGDFVRLPEGQHGVVIKVGWQITFNEGNFAGVWLDLMKRQ